MMRAQPRTARPSRVPLELACPRCDNVLIVPAKRRVEGAAVRCLHCGAEPELTRERQEHTRRYRWVLVDPELEAAEENERRQT